MTMKTPTLFPGTGPRQKNDLTKEQRDSLVQSCYAMCVQLAKKFLRPGCELDDLISEAALACVEAAQKWTPSLSTAWESDYATTGGDSKFSTYAHSFIRRHLQSVLQRDRDERDLQRLSRWADIGNASDEEDDTEINSEIPENAQKLLACLPPLDRQIVTAVQFRGNSPDCVAIQLDMPLKDLKLRIRNAAAAMRRQLDRSDDPGIFAETNHAEEATTLCGV